MEDVKQKYSDLISVNSFLKWCYNFKQQDIDKLCSQSSEFKHIWDKHILPSTEGAFTVDYLIIVDTLFSKASYKTMKLVIDLAVERYQNEQIESIDFVLKIDKKQSENRQN